MYASRAANAPPAVNQAGNVPQSTVAPTTTDSVPLPAWADGDNGLSDFNGV